MVILVTGGAGFIGSSLIDKLLENSNNFIISLDNFDNFYDKSIKLNNQKNHFNFLNFQFIEIDIREISNINFEKKIDCIVHLAAKAGVRPSIENPTEYFDVNINGTLAMLEFAKKSNIKQFVHASSSSVYGINQNIPWLESEYDLQPISPYAASKLACEKIGFTYSHLYNIRFLALRFFTVYGPKQRPDLAINKFINKIMNDEVIEVFGTGNTKRDYTFIDDIVNGIMNAIKYEESNYEIFNLGNNKSVLLADLIEEIGKICNKTPKIIFKNEQAGDVFQTLANIDKSAEIIGYTPNTSLKIGLKVQYEWILK